MKSLNDEFELTPEILQGMDGCKIIPNNVQSLRNGLAEICRAGDGVDYCIAAAMIDADIYQEGRAGDVLAHLKYQRDQLSLLIRNFESLTQKEAVV